MKMIRQARPEDQFDIAKLVYMVWEDMELDIVKAVPKDKILTAIEKSCVDVRYRTYYEHIYVYEVEGKIAGCIISYNGKYELEYEKAWEHLDLPNEFQQYGTPLPVKEAKDDECYIETIATFEEYRGRGIATKLLTNLLESNTNMKWSLNCDVNNQTALKLYQKVGFTFDGYIELYKHKYHHLIVK